MVTEYEEEIKTERYSVVNCTKEAVESMGGINIIATRHSGIIFATLTKAGALNLQNSGCTVKPVESVKTDVIAPPEPLPISVQPMVTPASLLEITGFEELRNLTDPPLFGLGMKVAMVDTGIRETHVQIAGKVIYSKNYTNGIMRDGFDHGTGVASILLNVAPECSILNLKVMDDRGEGTTEAVVYAIEDCIDMLDENPEIAPTVINLSLGTEDTGDSDDVLRVCCRAAIQRGIWIIAAAGNSGPYTGSVMCPACEENVIAAGSSFLIAKDNGYDFLVSEFSSRGPTSDGYIKPDVLFFGENIWMASSIDDSAMVAKSGTSFAAPFLSAIAALTQQGLALNDIDTRDLIDRYGAQAATADFITQSISAEDIIGIYLPSVTIKPAGAPVSKDNDYGYGIPFGDLVRQTVTGTSSTPLDISSLMTSLIFMGVVGMMMKSFR